MNGSSEMPTIKKKKDATWMEWVMRSTSNFLCIALLQNIASLKYYIKSVHSELKLLSDLSLVFFYENIKSGSKIYHAH